MEKEVYSLPLQFKKMTSRQPQNLTPPPPPPRLPTIYLGLLSGPFIDMVRCELGLKSVLKVVDFMEEEHLSKTDPRQEHSL